MARYRGILFAPDGEYVTDYERESIEAVEKALSERGSAWFFYSYEGVIRADTKTSLSRKRLVSAAYPIEHLEGKSVKKVSLIIRKSNKGRITEYYERINKMEKIICPECKKELDTIKTLSTDLEWNDNHNTYQFIKAYVYHLCPNCEASVSHLIAFEELIDQD